MFDWVFERANSQREQRKTLLQLSALFLCLSVSVAAIIRFCSWPMRERGTENVYIQYVSAAKCCCRGQQPVSNGLLWIGGRILCLSTCLSTLFTRLSEHVCVCVTERACVCMCLRAWMCACACAEIMRGVDLMKPSRQTWQTCTSLFSFFCLSISHCLLPCYIWMRSGSVSAAIYAQWMAKPSMGKIHAKQPYTTQGLNEEKAAARSRRQVCCIYRFKQYNLKSQFTQIAHTHKNRFSQISNHAHDVMFLSSVKEIIFW